MCGASPDLLPEVQSATCFSTLALAFGCVTFLGCFFWPFGLYVLAFWPNVLGGIFGVVGGAMVACCTPLRRQEQTPAFAGRMQVSAALFFVGAAGHFIQLILVIIAFIDHLPNCGRGGHDLGCTWHGFTLVVCGAAAVAAVVAIAFDIVAGRHCLLAKSAILRVGADPPSGERVSTQWREDLQHRGPTVAVAEATVVADCAPVQTVVGIPQGIPALAA